MVDGCGVKPCFAGELPEPCAAVNRKRLVGDSPVRLFGVIQKIPVAFGRVKRFRILK